MLEKVARDSSLWQAPGGFNFVVPLVISPKQMGTHFFIAKIHLTDTARLGGHLAASVNV
jgi:hypothetical protein